MLLNVALGAIDVNSAVGALTEWGLYAGEYVILVIWFAWGTGTILGRLALVSAIGMAWALSPWIGYAIARPDRAFSSRETFYYVFNVLPLAFAISSFPLMLFRKTSSFQLGMPKPSSRLGLLLLVPLSVCIAFAYSQCMYLYWNIVYSVVIGVFLATVSAICAPLLSSAILGESIRPRIILAVFVFGCVPGIYLANILAVPGPGPSGVVSAWFESIGSSILAISLAIGTFFYWRFIGVRFITHPGDTQSVTSTESRSVDQPGKGEDTVP